MAAIRVEKMTVPRAEMAATVARLRTEKREVAVWEKERPHTGRWVVVTAKGGVLVMRS